ncbi:MAG TPA: chemotaxis response regulator protein-glutamate methylesterase [Gemmatimonadales bacterium]|nr:chemotaxis response regulator protein-glutamate methylesterase [Gemmatimonadales bacterium]
MTGTPVHVLVVDDSAVMRESMTALLTSTGGFSVATAHDPIVARRKIAAQRPDVIVLDLAMPQEDGLTFLRDLMGTDPLPVVICSSHSTRGSRVALEALREGAVDVVAKPQMGMRDFVQESSIQLIDAIRAATRARVRRGRRHPASPARPAQRPLQPLGEPVAGSGGLVAIAASTGGPPALHDVLGGLTPDVPGVVVVQHMPAGFTAAFAEHLNQTCQIEVKEAATGDVVRRGRVLIAPGDHHLEVHHETSGLTVEVTRGPLISRHRPSADVLFRSVARAVGPDAMGVIITGMGDDGAAGLLEMHRAGAATLGQDEASCVVFGMPREAAARGAVDELVPLAGLSEKILEWAKAGRVPALRTRAQERIVEER